MKKKTMMGKLASLLFALALVWGGVACTQSETPAPTTYTITFDSGVESISVEEGAVAKEPTKPTKDGYEFIEWLNGTEAYNWALPVTSNLSLTAKWSAIKYTITYLPEGVKTDNPTNYTIESETITLKDPTLEEGKYFIAWHVDTEEGNVETEIAKGSTGNKTFFAEISSEKPCVVTFNDGTKDLASVNTKKDSKVALPTGYKEKYNFFSDKECKNAFDIATPITADTTIYVKVKTFTVTVKMLPFEKEIKIPEIPYGTVFTDEDLDLDSDEGYEYKGIFTDEACTKKFDMTKPITSDLTIYVKYEKVEAPSENEEFDKVSVSDDGKIVTIENPKFTAIWGCEAKGNVIEYAQLYAEAQWTCDDILDFNLIDIYYENTVEGAQLALKSSDGGEKREALTYPTLVVGEGKITASISDFVNANPDFKYVCLGNNNDFEYTLKITKIVLTKVAKLEDKVVFDAASFTAPEGMEIVEKDGSKYLKVTPNGYGSNIELPAPIDVTGYTSVEFTIYRETAEEVQHVISLKNYSGEGEVSVSGENGASCLADAAGVKTYSATLTGTLITAIQPIVQTVPGYASTTDKTMYIGKIVVKTN